MFLYPQCSSACLLFLLQVSDIFVCYKANYILYLWIRSTGAGSTIRWTVPQGLRSSSSHENIHLILVLEIVCYIPIKCSELCLSWLKKKKSFNRKKISSHKKFVYLFRHLACIKKRITRCLVFVLVLNLFHMSLQNSRYICLLQCK